MAVDGQQVFTPIAIINSLPTRGRAGVGTNKNHSRKTELLRSCNKRFGMVKCRLNQISEVFQVVRTTTAGMPIADFRRNSILCWSNYRSESG